MSKLFEAFCWPAEGVENAAMPQTSKEKQEAFRARQTLLGMTEVRGIFLPPALHATIKAMAKKLASRPPQRPGSPMNKD